MKKIKWEKNTMANGEYLEGKDFAISYVKNAHQDYPSLRGETNEETAITYNGDCYLLIGDHRKQYEKLFPKGYEACMTYFKKHKELKSMWSN